MLPYSAPFCLLFLFYTCTISMQVVVTVDGILLTKSGTMTGGLSGGMEARSNKWDDSRIESLYYPSVLFLELVEFAI